jgi:hypothetical protein
MRSGVSPDGRKRLCLEDRGMSDRFAEVETDDEEPVEASRFDVHEWFESYLAQTHDELADELVGVPLS